MFFIVSTGRSGTKTIAQFLDRASNATVFHEPSPNLRKEATQFVSLDIHKKEIQKILKNSRVPIDGKIYGESNHKLSFVIPALSEIFPEAKYIWLVRNPRRVINSFYRRMSYDPSRNKDDWEKWRIQGNKVIHPITLEKPAVDSEIWNSWNPFQKCCWYYVYTNMLILHDLNRYIGKDKWQVVYLEDLINKNYNLFDWLGLSIPDNMEVPHLNGKSDLKINWTDNQEQEYRNFVLEFANILGYTE